METDRAYVIDAEALYRRYSPMVLRRCRFLLRDEEQASDAMQDVFVQLLRKQEQLHGRYPSSLLYRMATNHSLNLLRRSGRRRLGHNEERPDNPARGPAGGGTAPGRWARAAAGGSGPGPPGGLRPSGRPAAPAPPPRRAR